MKNSWNRGLLATVGFIVLVVLLVLCVHKSKQPQIASPTSPIPTNTNYLALVRVNKPSRDFTESEKTALEGEFNERLKPAIDKWCNAYAGRLPLFNPTDINLNNFYARTDGGFYTFMLGSTTFTVLDNKNGTKVFYFMTKDAAKKLNSIPTDGQPRNLTVPITAKEVIQLVKADTGIEYEPKQIEIKPTAAASSIDGGAFVEVNRTMSGGMEVLTLNSLSFVVGSDGKLITYQH